MRSTVLANGGRLKGRLTSRLLTAVYALLILAPSIALMSMGTANANPEITEYPTPSENSTPYDITSGPDGNLWFTESNSVNPKIGTITTSGSITEYSLPRGDSPQSITSGPDGNLWFTVDNNSGGAIGQITTSGTITLYDTTDNPVSITSGSDGALWFTDPGAASIGQITTTGVITMYSIPDGEGDSPNGIALGSDGNVWFTAYNGNYIGRITPSGTITEYTIPTSGASPDGITSGPDGNLWFTESDGNNIGRITTSGTITEFSLPVTEVPDFITSAPDGALWFGEDRTDSIGRITTSGTIAEYPIDISGSAPLGITSGPDGNVWFADGGTNAVGTFDVSAPEAPADLSATSPTNTPPVLSWTASQEANSYNIYRNGTDIGSTTSTTYTDSSAPQGTNSYYVTAVNSLGGSDPSNTVNVSYDTTLPLLSYFTANNGSTFSRQSTPFTSGVATQTINSDGSITVAVNDAPGYADSGFYLYDGPLSGLPDFTVNSSSGDFGLNLWFDNANLGDFFQWNGSGVMTSTDGDTYGLSSGSTDGTLAVNSDTSFYMMNDGNNYTLAQLQAGDDSAVSPSTNVAVWVGVDVGSGGSTSATISSIEGL